MTKFICSAHGDDNDNCDCFSGPKPMVSHVLENGKIEKNDNFMMAVRMAISVFGTEDLTASGDASLNYLEDTYGKLTGECIICFGKDSDSCYRCSQREAIHKEAIIENLQLRRGPLSDMRKDK